MGNAAQFRDALKKEFPGAKYDEFSAADLDLLLPDLHHKPEPVPPSTPETLAQGNALLLAAGKAAGGSAALSKVQSLEFSGSGTSATPQGEIQTQLKLYIAYPDHYRMDTSVALPDQPRRLCWCLLMTARRLGPATHKVPGPFLPNKTRNSFGASY